MTAQEIQSAVPVSSGRSAWRSYLTSEAWSLAVAGTDDRRVLATCTLPQESGAATPMALLYQTGSDGGQAELTAMLPGVTRPGLLPHGLFGVHAHRDGRALCRFDDQGYAHETVAAVEGLRGLAHHEGSGLVAVLEGTGPADPFAAARLNPCGDALMARQRVSGWLLRILRVPATGEAEPVVTLPVGELVDDGAQPTGEVGWADADTVVVGISRDRHDGRRQLGLCLVTVGAGHARQVWHDDYDVHGVVADPGRGCALRASTRLHGARDPLRHELWLCVSLTDVLSPEVLDDGRELWRRPVAWSEHGLCALTVDRGRRRLEVFEGGRWRPVPTEAEPGSAVSVSSAVVNATAAAWVESSPSRPPVLCRATLGATEPPLVVDQGEPPPPVLGRAHHERLTVPEPWPHATAATVLLPADTEPCGVVALFHGGPTMAWADWSWRWNAFPYLERGYAVILVDPAGSDGFGSASWRAAWRNWHHGIAVSAACTLRSTLDRYDLRRLPMITMGGSFGGYLALAVAEEFEPVLIAAHATPVRPAEVALSSDAFWSWTREWGPLTGHARALEHESLDLSIVPATTRVLLSHGMLDEQVPFQQSVVAARELRLRGVPCDLVLLPDAGHALGRPEWIMAWYQWVLDALDRTGDPVSW